MEQRPHFVSFRGYWLMLRPLNLLIIAFTQYWGALFLVADPGPERWQMLGLADLHALVAAFVTTAAAGYLINDYYDVKIDYVNRPLKVAVDRFVHRRSAMLGHGFYTLLSLFFAYLVNWWVFALVFFDGLLLWLYSVRLKRTPFWGNLVVALVTSSSVGGLFLLFRSDWLPILTYTLFAMGITLIRELIKDVEDVRGDARYGCRTLPVVIGVHRTKYVLFVLLVLFDALVAACFIYLGGWFWVMALAFQPLFGYFGWLLYRADRKRHFAFLSSYAKVLMLVGVLSMVFLGG